MDLLIAIDNGNIEKITSYLCNWPSDVNYQNNEGCSLIDMHEFTRIILTHSLTRSLTCLFTHSLIYTGYTPIMIASFRNNLDIVSRLLSYGANADIPDLYGWTPLLLCAGIPSLTRNIRFPPPLTCTIAENNYCDIASAIIASNITINRKSNIGSTALIYSCEKNFYNMSSLLITHGADVNISNELGMSYVPHFTHLLKYSLIPSLD